MGWLKEAVNHITAVCVIISMVECVVDDGWQNGGLRMVCGLAAASSIVRLASDALRELF